MTLVDKAEVQTPSQFNFLTKETAEQLRSSVTERETRRRRKVTHTEQPLDYASHSSGMLRSVSEQKNQDV